MSKRTDKKFLPKVDSNPRPSDVEQSGVSLGRDLTLKNSSDSLQGPEIFGSLFYTVNVMISDLLTSDLLYFCLHRVFPN